MKVKVLPLSSWALSTRGRERTLMHYKEIPTIFNRDGRYCMNSKNWMEIAGKAYEDNTGMFQYELANLNRERIGSKEAEAYQTLMRLTTDPLVAQLCRDKLLGYEPPIKRLELYRHKVRVQTFLKNLQS